MRVLVSILSFGHFFMDLLTVKLVITVRAIVFGFHAEVFQLTPKVC